MTLAYGVSEHLHEHEEFPRDSSPEGNELFLPQEPSVANGSLAQEETSGAPPSFMLGF